MSRHRHFACCIEQVKQASQGFVDRISNPLAFAVLFFYVILNWKLFVLLFLGDVKDPNERICSIESMYSEFSCWKCIWLLLGPIALGFAYAYGMLILRRKILAWVDAQDAHMEIET